MSRKNWTDKKIFERLLYNKTQQTFWNNINELQNRPNQFVYDTAYKLAQSSDEKERIIGIYVLAQLGFDPRMYQQKTVDLYFDLLKNETSLKVLVALLSSIGHNNDRLSTKQINQLINFNLKNHHLSTIRYYVVMSLLSVKDDSAISTLIELSNDCFSNIRNWATFGLGSQIEIDNPTIKKSLWNRVNDIDEETKMEAIIGLSERKDEKIRKMILQELDYAKNNTDYAEKWSETLNECLKTLDEM